MLYSNAHNNIIHNSQKDLCLHKEINEQNMVNIHSGILFNYKKAMEIWLHYNTERP